MTRQYARYPSLPLSHPLSHCALQGHSGFLSRVFAPFSTHGVSVDLIATSQYAVSVTLDHIPDGVHGDTMRKVIATLSKQCTTSVRHPCAVVSIVGRSLRNALPELGRAMQALKGISVHMVCVCVCVCVCGLVC